MILLKNKCASIAFAIATAIATASFAAAQSSQTGSTPLAGGVFTLLNGSWMAPNIQTFPAWIGNEGDVVGTYLDTSWTPHGFVQMHDCRPGNFADKQTGCGQTFILDAIGALEGTSYGGTWLNGMDASGTVLGRFTDGDGLVHGALWRRSCDWRGQCSFKFQSFDPPGVTTYILFPDDYGTFPSGISATGVIIGSYTDNDLKSHPFVATPRFEWPFSQADIKLEFSTLPFPDGAGASSLAIGQDGIVAGDACSASSCEEFLRSPWGAIRTFDSQAPGSEIQPASVNSFGAIVGSIYGQPNGSFLQLPNGTTTTLDFGPAAINDRGEIMGSGAAAIILRKADGTEVAINPPAPWIVMRGTAMNDRGWITGWVYDDSTFLPTAFVWKPGK